MTITRNLYLHDPILNFRKYYYTAIYVLLSVLHQVILLPPNFCLFEIMAVGKNKSLSKGGKKGTKKKIIDPFTRKDWYDVKAPSMFAIRQVGKTLVNRTQGTKIASEGLKGRVFEVSLADLQNDTDAERSFRKFKLIAEDVQGRDVLTNFHGMDLTTDKLR